MSALNNLVTELFSATDLPAGDIAVTNPRDGWLYIAASTDGDVEVSVDGKPVGRRRHRGTAEVMVHLSQGDHVVTPGSPVAALVIRTMPALVYCKHQYDPHIPEFGPYDWAFLQDHVLPHVNTVIGDGSPDHASCMQQWKALGGQWIIECPLPGLSAKSVTAEETFDVWSQNAGVTDPLTDGLIVDEFISRNDPRYAAWSEAYERLFALPAFSGKLYIPYTGEMYRGSMCTKFLQRTMDCGFPFAWEQYMHEEPTRVGASARLAKLESDMENWEANIPGSVQRMILCMGYMTITESLNWDPSVDYKVWMDMQFQHIATRDPFKGLYGLMEYTSGYADDETVRWAARLYRHYGIDGQRDLLSERLGYRYHPDHLQNPDFSRACEGWTVAAAADSSVATRWMDGYSYLQGRYPRTAMGDSFLWLQRQQGGPNSVSQELRHLKPGQHYSVKCIAADYGDLTLGRSVQHAPGITLTVDGGNVIPDKSFVSTIANNYAHTLGPFTGDHKAWLTHHHLVFKATTKTGRLTISDWTPNNTPGGPAGQEIMLNFVEVQPYWMGDE